MSRSMEAMEETGTNEQEEEYKRNLNRVKNVIDKLKDAFKSIENSQDTKIQSIREKNSERIQQLKDELEYLDDQKEPKTVIAIVGATGEGKSSLINALLDHRNVLPTSGHRACTAVVVEVEGNAESDQFEADIEFRSREEWSKERECLLKDLTKIDGGLKTQMPESSSESYASYLKMMAVYGRIDNNEESTEITKWLGKRKTVFSRHPEEFRQLVEKYIIQSEDTEDEEAELQYWPIVERVRLKIPNCDVCSSRAKLVDLPGVSDYNAARENVTKEYLKTCKAVWVVSNIGRAIDAKTAKTLLDENFRRQLLMDGHYANIAFICSKTDDINYSECTKVNKRIGVQGKVDEIKDYIIGKEEEKKQCNKELQSYREDTNRIKEEYDRIQQLRNGESNDDSETVNKQIIEQCISKVNGIEQDLVNARKGRSAICADARNKYSSQQIKKDFKAGLREMKSQAKIQEDAEEEEDEDEEDEAENKLADSLQVFCCSATEYQRLQNPLPDDEPPKVFSAAEETQVPQLRNYVHTVTRENKKQAMDFLISSLCRLVSDVQNVMTNSSMKNDMTDICNEYVKRSNNTLKAITQTMSDGVTSSFSDISSKLTNGSTIAEEQATVTCISWGNTQTPRKDTGRGSRGPPYPHKTYMATIYRQGEFRSPTYGYINFNRDLVLPILDQQTIVWHQVFNHEIPSLFEKTKKDARLAVSKLIDEMYSNLAEAGYPDAKDEDVLYNIMMRLEEMTNSLGRKAGQKQRDLSRSVTPYIQSCLSSTYNTCSLEKGKGMFQRIKGKVHDDIYMLKDTMFHTAIEEVTKGLELLKDTVVQDVKQVCELLVEDLKTGLKSRTVTQSEYGALITDIKKCAKILRPPGTISSSQGSQEENESTSIQDDNKEGKAQSKEGKTQHNGQSEVGSGEPAETPSILSPLKRKQDFDERFNDLKRQKLGKNCYMPGDLDQVLIQSKVDYEEQCHIEQKLKKNCHDNGLEYLGDTPRNGDCFFEAITSQLSRIGALESGSALQPVQLRLKVSEYIQQHPTYEGPEGSVSLENYMDGTTIEEYCERMAKRGTWADHVVVVSMARMLERDIVIVTSSPSTSENECLTWVIGDTTMKKKPLLLAHLWENHYQSLQPI